MLDLESRVSDYLLGSYLESEDLFLSLDDVLEELHPHQRTAFESESDLTCLLTGIGGGKTHVGARWIRERAKLYPTEKHLVTINTHPQGRDVVLPAIERALDEDGIEWTVRDRNSGPTYTLDLPGGQAQILVRSLHNPDSLRGIEVVSWWGDEVRDATEYACNVAFGRLRSVENPEICRTLWTTSPNGHDHLWRRFAKGIEPIDGGTSNGYPVNLYRQDAIGEVGTDEYIPSKLLIQTDTRANASLGKNYGAGLAAAYDPSLLKQERGGEFTVVGNRVYYSFSYDHNVSHSALLNTRRPWSICLDFGGAAHNSLIVVQERGGVTHVPDEIYLSGGGTPAVIAEFLARYDSVVRENPPAVYGDASGKWGSTTDINGAYEMWRGALPASTSFRIQESNPSEENRLASVNRRLLSGDGVRKLKVHPDCEHLIMDFEQVQPDELTGKQRKNKDTADLTHCADALGYYIHWRFPVIARRAWDEIEAETVL